MAELASVRAVVISEVTFTEEHVFTDGVDVIVGEDVLVVGQSDPTQNGVYVLAFGQWTRRADFSTLSQMIPMTHLKVREGTIYSGSRWYLANIDPLSESAPKTFVQESHGQALEAGSGLKIDNLGRIGLIQRPDVAGTYTAPTLSIGEFGEISAAETGAAATTYIEGLNVRAADTIAPVLISVDVGAAYIPGYGRIVEVDQTISFQMADPSVGNYWYFYLTLGPDGQPIIIAKTGSGSPLEPERGFARYGDLERMQRYIGMLSYNAVTGKFRVQRRVGDEVMYLSPETENYVVNDHSSTTVTDYGTQLLERVPAYAQSVLLKMDTGASAADLLSVLTVRMSMAANESTIFDFAPNDYPIGARSVALRNIATGGFTDLAVLGYMDRLG